MEFTGSYFPKFSTVPTMIFDEETSFDFSEFQNLIPFALYGDKMEIIQDIENFPITRFDLYSLIGDNWLNDNIINFYMLMIARRSEKVLALNIDFMRCVMQDNHEGARSHLYDVNIFSADLVFLPMHVNNNHWSLMVVNNRNESIKYYDSAGVPNEPAIVRLAGFLENEAVEDRRKMRYLLDTLADGPMQETDNDCGVFTCMTAEYLSRRKTPCFTQVFIPYFRRKMMVDILKGFILNN